MADQTVQGIGQKIKGKVQQVAGDVKMNTGNQTGGAWDKVKGKTNDIVGGLRIDTDDDTKKAE